MRIDLELVKRGIFPSRQKAKEAIAEGKVKLCGEICTKPSLNVSEDDEIELCGEIMEYVGRGGLKLRKLIEHTGISLKGSVCMDIGASTGGFTDCMLENGAAYVYAVDVGYGQLAEKLREDERVCCMEKTDIRDISKEMLDKTIDFISVDVSFISLKLILPKIYELLSENGSAALLIKPQFEAGRKNIGKKGVVKNEKIHERVLTDITAAVSAEGFFIKEIIHSPIKGGSGNIEYLAFIDKSGERACIDVKETVRNAFEQFKKGR